MPAQVEPTVREEDAQPLRVGVTNEGKVVAVDHVDATRILVGEDAEKARKAGEAEPTPVQVTMQVRDGDDQPVRIGVTADGKAVDVEHEDARTVLVGDEAAEFLAKQRGKRARADEESEKAEGLAVLTVAELTAKAEGLGLDVGKRPRKDDLIAQIEKAEG